MLRPNIQKVFMLNEIISQPISPQFTNYLSVKVPGLVNAICKAEGKIDTKETTNDESQTKPTSSQQLQMLTIDMNKQDT